VLGSWIKKKKQVVKCIVMLLQTVQFIPNVRSLDAYTGSNVNFT